MHLAIETGLPVVTLTSPQAVQFSTSNQTQDTIPGCVLCGTTTIEEIGYDDDGMVWECRNGHRSHEVDEIACWKMAAQVEATMPVEAALAELAAHCWGEYDFPGDTARDEHGRAA